MAKTYKVKGFTRKGGVKVKAQTRKAPKLSAAERKRRGKQALSTLLPAAIKWVGEVGFDEAVKKLSKATGINNPKMLAGWLKGQAKKKGVLSAKHKYVGRKGFRKYPAQYKSLGPAKYKQFLRMKRA